MNLESRREQDGVRRELRAWGSGGGGGGMLDSI